MDGNGWNDPVFAEDHAYAETQIPPLRSSSSSRPGCLKTMGNPLIAGRDFTWTDVYDKRPVAMVSENLARELWREPAAALGKRIRENLKVEWREVVGVVGDERDDGVDQKAPATVLLAAADGRNSRAMQVFVQRGAGLRGPQRRARDRAASSTRSARRCGR